MAIDLRKCGEIPIIRHPSSGSADCRSLENALVRGGTSASWTLPPSYPPVNAPDNYWADEETNQYVTLEDGTFIEWA